MKKAKERVKARFQHDAKRGVVYVFDDKTGDCLLRVEGLPELPEGEQIDIHLVRRGNEHHHHCCAGGSKIGAENEPGIICAVKMEEADRVLSRAR